MTNGRSLCLVETHSKKANKQSATVERGGFMRFEDDIATGEQQHDCLAGADSDYRARAVLTTICMKSMKILKKYGFLG